MGRRIRTSVPRSGQDSNSIVPSASITMSRTTDKPRPVPIQLGLVVKNGSKALARTSSDIPLPSSVSVRHIHFPSFSSTWMRNVPISPMASRALAAMLITISAKRPASILTSNVSSGSSSCRHTREPNSCFSIGTSSLSAAPTSRSSSWTASCLLKFKSFLLMANARLAAISTLPSASCRASDPLSAKRSRWVAWPRMIPSTLLKSCATPLARRPIASIFCA